MLLLTTTKIQETFIEDYPEILERTFRELNVSFYYMHSDTTCIVMSIDGAVLNSTVVCYFSEKVRLKLYPEIHQILLKQTLEVNLK